MCVAKQQAYIFILKSLRLINYNEAAVQASFPGEPVDVYIPTSQPEPEVKKFSLHWNSRRFVDVCRGWAVRKGVQLTFRTLFRNPSLFSAAGLHPQWLLLVILLLIYLTIGPSISGLHVPQQHSSSLFPMFRGKEPSRKPFTLQVCLLGKLGKLGKQLFCDGVDGVSCLALSENHFLSSFRNIHYFCGNTRIHYIKALNLGSTAKR